MNLVLPPKRFQDPSDPIYDAIRFRPWFHGLEERRAKIPMLVQAYSSWNSGDIGQYEACVKWGVDPREVRDYEDFIQLRSPRKMTIDPQFNRTCKYIIDEAYRYYGLWKGEQSFSSCIAGQARSMALNPRQFQEMWEIDPNLYPSTYEK